MFWRTDNFGRPDGRETWRGCLAASCPFPALPAADDGRRGNWSLHGWELARASTAPSLARIAHETRPEGALANVHARVRETQ